MCPSHYRPPPGPSRGNRCTTPRHFILPPLLKTRQFGTKSGEGVRLDASHSTTCAQQNGTTVPKTALHSLLSAPLPPERRITPTNAYERFRTLARISHITTNVERVVQANPGESKRVKPKPTKKCLLRTPPITHHARMSPPVGKCRFRSPKTIGPAATPSS